MFLIYLIGKIYLYPIHAYQKSLGGKMKLKETMELLDSESFDKFLLGE
jgi:hypothetical protein